MRSMVSSAFYALAGRFGGPVLKYRSVLVIATQLTLIYAANVTAFELRLDADVPPQYRLIMWNYLTTVLMIYGASLWAFGIQRGLWRYVGLHDLGRILWASCASSAVFYAMVHLLFGRTEYPRSVIVLTGLLSGLYLAGIRLA